MVRGRAGEPDHPQLGHEQFGEVVEIGTDVEHIKLGDIVRSSFILSLVANLLR
jgi:D-arabinose 1-dehydrogenase-like Zn-dependent alcohol dehydrogenase